MKIQPDDISDDAYVLLSQFLEDAIFNDLFTDHIVDTDEETGEGRKVTKEEIKAAALEVCKYLDQSYS